MRAENEKKAVAADVKVFKEKLRRVQNAFERAGRSIINSLKLADANRDGTLSLDEFLTTLTRAGVSMPT